MALSQAQKTIYQKALKAGSGAQAVALSSSALRALIYTEANDLGVQLGGDVVQVPDFFGSLPSDVAVEEGLPPRELFEELVAQGPVDADSYFSSLATLHRARLKYQNILRLQPLPTLEQVGPRGLLQYGMASASALGSLLRIRKWMYDIDNRAAQETGYVFEPIIAGAIGGTPVSAKSSPVRRNGEGGGRQIDCLAEDRAYEIKLRVTIAASGQGRWGEELAFPRDARLSGYTPVLTVFDPTPNAKLSELTRAFEDEGGTVFAGDDAWAHLEAEAGPTMGTFLERYVRRPLADVLSETPETLPSFELAVEDHEVTFLVGGEAITSQRSGGGTVSDASEIPDDVDDLLPGF